VSATCIEVLCEVARRLAFMEPLRERELPPPSAAEAVVAVDVGGEEGGTIYVLFGPGLPRELASNMLARDPDEDWSARDATLETANVIAGNLAPFLGADTRLGIPRLAQRPAPPWRMAASLELTEGLLSVIVCAAATGVRA
jgi:hypothetical protein